MRRHTTSLLAAAALAVAGGAAPALGAVAATPPGLAWATAPMHDMVQAHGWPAADATALGRIATRRELARALAELMQARGIGPTTALRRPPDVGASDTDAAAISWVSTVHLLGAPGATFSPNAAVTGTDAESAIVQILGLGPAAAGLARLHTQSGSGFALPSGFASSVLVAELGLRHNYPLSGEPVATSTAAPLPLAELAGMIDGAMHLPSWQVANVQKFAGIVLPDLTTNQRTVIQNALSQVGQPYVWGGTSPGPQHLWGLNLPGGFDCSGLVWWAYKYGPGTAGLGTDLVGRTADDMAWERPSERVALTAMRPGDLVFFGTAGAKTTRGNIAHVGIYLGNGWMVHSNGSSDGTTITNLASWWPSAMAWARRPAAMGRTGPVTTSPTPTPSAPHTTAPPPATSPMTPLLWRAAEAFVRTHYAPRLRAHTWLMLTSHPQVAADVLGRQMTRARWVVLEGFIAAHYARPLRARVWTELSAHPTAAYGVLFAHGLA